MSKLDELLAIPNKQERQAALIEYARLLGISVAKAKRENGELKEEELAVLIYDAQQARGTAKSQNVALAVGALIFFVIVVGLIFFLANVMGGKPSQQQLEIFTEF